MSQRVERIFLKNTATGGPVEAEIREGVDHSDLATWVTTWMPQVSQVVASLQSQGASPAQFPQSFHWNWMAKAQRSGGLLSVRFFSIWSAGELQGLMQLDLTKYARIPDQGNKPIVYIEYLETAPWNRPPPFSGPLFLGVGTMLMAKAINVSIDEGFRGRFGLHSLPQADSFYRSKCRMTDLGPDAGYQNLRYFEASTAQAQQFAKAALGETI